MLYDIPDELVRGKPSGRKSLEQIEGRHYHKQPISVQKPDGTRIEVSTFVAKDVDRKDGLSTAVWYVSWIIYGLREHKVDENYIEHVREIAIQTNLRAIKNDEDQIRLIKNL